MKHRITVDVASIAAVIVLSVAGLFLARAHRHEDDAWQWVTHTRQVLEGLQQVLFWVRSAESAQRGHLLTRQPDFLADMNKAEQVVPLVVADIARLTQDNPRQQAAIPRLRQLALARLQSLSQAISRSDGTSLDDEGLRQGREQSASLAQQVDAMLQEEQRLLVQREAEVRSARQLESLTTASVALLAVMLVGLLRAVSQRDARAIRQGAARVDAVFRAAPVGLGIVDANLRLAELNQALAQLLGDPPEALVGHRLDPDRVGPTARQLQSICQEVMTHGSPKTGVELTQPGPGNQQRDWLASFHPVTEHQNTAGVVMAALEVTNLRLSQRELAEANRLLELRVAERTAELSVVNEDLQAFAHTVAHDLRAPLRNIEGFSTALLEDETARLSEEGSLYLQRIQAGVWRMDQLITDLLAYSRLSRGALHLEPVSVESAVAEALRELQPVIIERRAVIEAHPALPQVLANRSLLVQVLVNLLSNAIKYVASGTPPRVVISGRGHGGMVDLVVDDNGIGIAREHRDRVFGVFERLHGQEAYPGTGIGLAIVKRAVTKMNGTVSVEDSPLGGARLRVSLPADTEGA